MNFKRLSFVFFGHIVTKEIGETIKPGSQVQEAWFDSIENPKLDRNTPFTSISQEAELDNKGGRDSKLYEQLFPYDTQLRWEIVRQRA
ncbi:unnamed protein product [Fusarium graminearum]|nr:unnamed protein product [Fusarium graminearum]